MTYRRRGLLASAILTIAAACGVGAPAAIASGPARVQLKHSASPVAGRTPSVGSVPASSSIPFTVNLALSDPQGAQAFATAVSTPGNSSYRQYLTSAQWVNRFGPSAQSVQRVTQFLRSNGFTVGQVPDNRLFVPATGTAQQIEKAFSTALSLHRVDGQRLRLATKDLSVPADIGGTISGVAGVSQAVMRPTATTGAPAPTRSTSTPTASNGQSIPPPPGFRVAPPCGEYFNQQLDTTLPPYGNGYPANPPWAVCGYTPAQYRLAYGLSSQPADGTGVRVGIVDAYASSTLFSDAHKYAHTEDPTHPLKAGQFSEVLPKKFKDLNDPACDPSGWSGEQTLDVEAVHATAPGADIVYSGAKSCYDDDLTVALNKLVSKHLADVITNSYGDAGESLVPASDRALFDDVLQQAAATGISVMFSSGDWEDNFPLTGVTSPTYPASSTWATGIGGTTLAIGSDGSRQAEYGWSTARSFLCNDAYIAAGGCTAAQKGQWLPIDLALDGGSGGGTSSAYPQPSWQAGVVPTSLSERGSSSPMRVEPDISMDADPATGMLVGETQTFPDGVYYDTYRIGGTSLASPLMAGVVARADQTAGTPLGFLNPALYAAARQPGAVDDVAPAGKLDQSRSDFANSLDASDGYLYTTRIIDYEGPEQYCSDPSTPSTCSTQRMTLDVTPGYDNMTGLGSPGPGFINALVAQATGH